jgi:hypothetical protein
MRFLALIIFLCAAFAALPVRAQEQNAGDVSEEEALPEETEQKMIEMPVVKLRSLDKVTARTKTFEANVGSTIKFGPLYIKTQSCRKSSPLEKPEAASFLQVWEVNHEEEAQWIFSGWMFASSPGLSSMDHPIYDVWVLDCLEAKTEQSAEEKQEEEARGEGEIPEEEAPAEPAISTE